MFPSLSILQHYVEFNIHIIIMLEKLFSARSFGGSIGHLVIHQTILPAFSNKLSLPFMV